MAALLVAAICVNSAFAQHSSDLDFLIVPAAGFRKVDVIIGDIFDVNLRSNIIKLLDGTAWEGSGMIILPAAEILILPIPGQSRFAVAYSDGMTDVVSLIDGQPVTRPGVLLRVLAKSSDGGVLKLSTGDVLELGYDKFRAATWLVPFDAVLVKDKLYNLRKGRSVRVRPFRHGESRFPSRG